MGTDEIVNTICECASSSVDWSQFWPSMIATFAGFVLALLGQFAFEKCKSIFESKGLLKRLKTELEDIKTTLEKFKPGDIEPQPLKTLVWDEAINAGQVSLLNASKRVLLFKIYKQIQEFNSWFEIQTNYYFEHNNQLNEGLKKELIKQQQIMLGEQKDSQKIDISYVLSII